MPPAATTADAPLEIVDGDPDMLRASNSFFNAWFVQKNTAAAFAQLSPSSYTCYNTFRGDEDSVPATREDAGKRLMEGMTRAAELVGAAELVRNDRTRLEGLITGIEPHHPDLKLVNHAAAAAFTVVAIPNAMAEAASCDRLKPGLVPHMDRDGAKEYGKFYAAATRFKRAGADGAILWTVWAREGGEWKVVSYLVIVP